MERLLCRIEIPVGSCLDLDSVQFEDGVLYSFQSSGLAGLFLRGTIHRVTPEKPALFYLGERVPDEAERRPLSSPLADWPVESGMARRLGWIEPTRLSRSRRSPLRLVAGFLALAFILWAVTESMTSPPASTWASSPSLTGSEYRDIRRSGDLEALARRWNVGTSDIVDPDRLLEVFGRRPRSEKVDVLTTIYHFVEGGILDREVTAHFFERLLLDTLHEPRLLRLAIVGFKSCVRENPERALASLLPLLEHWDPEIRRQIPLALGALDVEAALPRLLDALSSESDPGVLSDLVFGIGMYREPEHARHLLPFADHPSQDVRDACEIVIRRLEKAATKSKPQSGDTSRAGEPSPLPVPQGAKDAGSGMSLEGETKHGGPVRETR
ncbi:MAG: HEAT repeat domain-containing protein [Planctomycetota bacterium]